MTCAAYATLYEALSAGSWAFRTFPEAIAFVGRVAEAAERAQHHPDLDIRYTKVTAVLSTHDAGGKVTQQDVDLAHAMERLAGA